MKYRKTKWRKSPKCRSIIVGGKEYIYRADLGFLKIWRQGKVIFEKWGYYVPDRQIRPSEVEQTILNLKRKGKIKGV